MEGEPAVAGDLIASRYRIVERIGEGGMGVVFEAVDEQLRRPVAIKFLPPSLARDADRLGRFRNEARTLSALNHPHIVTIYEIGDAAASPFIAMERVEGDTLRVRLRAGRLSLHDAVDITMQIARALDAAHERGIVHRDIKPDNVILRRDGYVKVLDFGLAVLRSGTKAATSMLTGGSLETVLASVAGTPAYMSPEQLEGRPVDARSDVFSLSAIQLTPAPAVQNMSDLPGGGRPPLRARTVSRRLARANGFLPVTSRSVQGPPGTATIPSGAFAVACRA
jgi:serine/threonine protein kinase